MQKGEKLHYIDAKGNEYKYIVKEVKQDCIVVAWEENQDVSINVPMWQVETFLKLTKEGRC